MCPWRPRRGPNPPTPAALRHRPPRRPLRTARPTLPDAPTLQGPTRAVGPAAVARRTRTASMAITGLTTRLASLAQQVSGLHGLHGVHGLHGLNGPRGSAPTRPGNGHAPPTSGTPLRMASVAADTLPRTAARGVRPRSPAKASTLDRHTRGRVPGVGSHHSEHDTGIRSPEKSRENHGEISRDTASRQYATGSAKRPQQRKRMRTDIAADDMYYRPHATQGQTGHRYRQKQTPVNELAIDLSDQVSMTTRSGHGPSSAGSGTPQTWVEAGVAVLSLELWKTLGSSGEAGRQGGEMSESSLEMEPLPPRGLPARRPDSVPRLDLANLSP